jgi:hypothetical protein
VRWTPTFALVALVSLLASSAATGSRAPSQSACEAAVSLTQTTPEGWLEVRGTATRRGQFWALGFGLGTQQEPSKAVFSGVVSQPQPKKIVWRMTGSGSFRINAFAPSGTRVNPVWGPEKHIGSNWNRPGAEWGTGWFFWEPGCWEIRAVRGKTIGRVFLLLL